MLDVALAFLRDELNGFIAARSGSDAVQVKLTRIADERGRYAFAEDSLGLSLIGVEEERAVRAQLRSQTVVEGQQVVQEPELKLNLNVLVAANFKFYDQALKYLTWVLLYFQSHPVFTREAAAGLDPQIERLVVELQSLSFEQLNQMWGFVGAKQLPAAVYRVRMVVLQDLAVAGMGPPITEISTRVGSR